MNLVAADQPLRPRAVLTSGRGIAEVCCVRGIIRNFGRLWYQEPCLVAPRPI